VSVTVRMPKLGMTMQTGRVSRWSKNEGDHVEKGEELFEVETEKITNKVESPASGVLFQIVVPEGATVPVGAIVALIAEPGEQLERIEGVSAGDAMEATPKLAGGVATAGAERPGEKSEILATPAAKRLARELGVDLTLVRGTGPDGRIKEGDVTLYHEEACRKPKITPLAEEIARQAGLDISTITGTGEGGKITREDVERSLEQKRPVVAEEVKPARTIPLAGMRKAIADNMHASLQNTAQLSMFTEVDVTESIRFLNMVREQYKKDESVKLSLNDIVILATSRALKRFPIMNSTLAGNEILLHDRVAMGIAVAISDGLIVPVLQDADGKGLLEIARETRILIGKARGGSLTMDEVTGGTFTITNLRASCVDHFTPILKPPETGILGVGRVVEKPVVYKGEIAVRSMMGLSLTIDHRVVDGTPASEFLQLLARFLAEPALILT
jgi:pyruvate dehydrogenase E2 component (dihydrolipoamide acetyltransferase)